MTYRFCNEINYQNILFFHGKIRFLIIYWFHSGRSKYRKGIIKRWEIVSYRFQKLYIFHFEFCVVFVHVHVVHCPCPNIHAYLILNVLFQFIKQNCPLIPGVSDKKSPTPIPSGWGVPGDIRELGPAGFETLVLNIQKSLESPIDYKI